MEDPKLITAKSIILKYKKVDAMGLSYGINMYRGCQHNCIYCDSRSSHYQIKDLLKIKLKENGLKLLSKELKGLKKGTIGTGCMNDPYMPIESKFEVTRSALKIIADHNFPVHIITKSDLVVRDIDLIKRISKVYAAVSITITTMDEELAKKIEPNAPSPKKRIEALKKLSQAGIYAGITLMPLLPYLTDNEENVKEILNAAKRAGAKYILPFLGVTLRDVQKDHYFKKLDENFDGVLKQHIDYFGDSFACQRNEIKYMYGLIRQFCNKNGIDYKIEFYDPNEKQNSLFDYID